MTWQAVAQKHLAELRRQESEQRKAAERYRDNADRAVLVTGLIFLLAVPLALVVLSLALGNAP